MLELFLSQAWIGLIFLQLWGNIHQGAGRFGLKKIRRGSQGEKGTMQELFLSQAWIGLIFYNCGETYMNGQANSESEKWRASNLSWNCYSLPFSYMFPMSMVLLYFFCHFTSP